MQLDALAIDLHPRSMMEASDLGVRLVQSRSRDVWRSFLPVFLVVLAVALATVEIAPWLPMAILFWLKPWLDRSLLFVMSRAVFGEGTRFADLWREQRSVWWGQWLRTLTVRRLSPWRSFTQPAYQLEGQHGAGLSRRRRQLLRGKKWSALLLQTAYYHLEWIFVLSLYVLGILLEPSGHRNFFDGWLHGDDIASALTVTVGYALAVLVAEPFFVAAGFAMYLNRRVELEGWDIEQEFRRAFAA